MSQIIIKEFDNTRAVSEGNENFAVVVVGYAEKTNPKFDDNGIYECNSQVRFKADIGLKGAGEQVDAVPGKFMTAEVTAVEKFETGVNYYTRQTATDHTAKKLRQEVITGQGEEAVTTYYDYTFALYFDKDEDPASITCPENTFYTLAGDGDLGEDPVEAETTTNNYGNQVAYELLGLGYTVLFVNAQSTTLAASLEALKDKAVYDFRYLIDATKDGSMAQQLHNVAAARGDCYTILDIPESKYTSTTATKVPQATALNNMTTYVNGLEWPSEVDSFIAPWVDYTEEFQNNRGQDYKDAYKTYILPGAFHALACAAKASKNYAEWYAVSGYNRGTCDFVGYKPVYAFGDAAQAMFQKRAVELDSEPQRAVNLIVTLRNEYYLWGSRTAKKLGKKEDHARLTAGHFLNIRQLCCTLKKQIYITCRQLTFDSNNDLLEINFKNRLRPILEQMKTDNGILDYRFERVESDEPATFCMNIRIVPIEPVEDFEINVMLEDSIAGTVIGETEAE